MKSMTGFGQGRGQSPFSLIDVSLRAVNGRFMETRFHLPREFHAFELDLKKIIAKYFERGTIDIFVSRRLKGTSPNQTVQVNSDLAKQYYQAYQLLARDLKIRSELHIETIARWPDVIKIDDGNDVPPIEKKSLFQAFEKACKACDSERHHEGKSLRKDMEDSLASLEKEVSHIQDLREEVNQTLWERFESKIKSKIANLEIDSARLSQEVVMQLEKSDINEELTRLREHTKNYRHLFSESGPQGKKLDFYTQELLREVNTIGSKSSVSKLTQSVVEAKALIERLREQVQNIE